MGSERSAATGRCYCGAHTHVSLVSDGDQGECATEFTVEKDDPVNPKEWWPCPKCGAECEVEWDESVAATTGENLAARVQEAQRRLDTRDADEIIAWILEVPVEEVRRVSRAANL